MLFFDKGFYFSVSVFITVKEGFFSLLIVLFSVYPSKRSNAGEMSDISRQRSNPAVGGASGAGIPYGGMGAVGPQITHEMLIPGNKCGLIIGKNGETIKSLQVCYFLVFILFYF